MNRSQSRGSSPTLTAFSGISNYRTEQYRPIRDTNVPAVPQIDYRTISRTHFEELSSYLAAYLSRSPPNSRSNARQKLTRLTIQQFHELSTDVYDELVRRKNDKETPFLPVRADFHPKRNQARQKLATLPVSRFEDLSSDVYYELARRYPEFKEPSGRNSATSNYDDYPNPDFPPRTATSGRTSSDRDRNAGDSGYGGSVSSRRPSVDRRRGEPDYPSGRRSEDGYAPSIVSSMSMRRKQQMQENPRRPSEDRGRRGGNSISGMSDSTLNAGQSNTAASAVIIPNKSTITEEEIEVPYGRDPARESTSTALDDGVPTELEPPDSASDYPSPMSPRSPPVTGLNALGARLMAQDSEPENEKSADDYYDKYGRGASAASDRSGMGSRMANLGNSSSNRNGPSEDPEQMRKDYEFKIANMQTQIATLERRLGDAEETEKKWREGEAKARQLEEDLAGLRRRAEEQGSAMRALQKELDELKETRQREKERESRRAREDEEELQILRDRCEKLEQDRENQRGITADPDIIDQLRGDIQGLMLELGDLSRRNDELMTAKDSDLIVIRDLNEQLKEYKRKYEQAKTELRSVKATSQLFLQTPKFGNDSLPVTSDGGVLDIHVTAFLSAIDALLTAGRSNAPTRVLVPMKAIVNSVTAVVEDVRAFERRPQRERSDVDLDALRSLRERADSTLSNLATAAKTHATSSGLSPVSLLDAAASHLSATVTEICKTVCMRRATQAEQELFASSSPGSTATSGFTPALKSVDESLQRNGSTSSSRYPETSPVSPRSYDYRRRTPSENSSSNTNSPPPIFDQPTASGRSDGSGTTAESANEDNWAELKPYLEAQTESIVYAIQSVLSGVRSPNPSPTLTENVTQIITIVSSIVAVCTDNLPPGSVQQGNEILRELSDHANRLSEAQALPEMTKESRQIMAKSSFAIANAMKGLMKL